MNQEYAIVESGHFVRLTPAENSQFNLGKTRDEFKSEMKQGTWWTPITLRKEDRTHSSWMEELHETMSGAEGPTKCQRSKSKKDGMTKGW